MDSVVGALMCLLAGAMTWALSSGAGFADISGAVTIWKLPLDPKRWVAMPEEVRAEEMPRQLIFIDGTATDVQRSNQPPYSVRESDVGVAFEVIGRVTQKRTMRWFYPLPQKDMSQFTHYLLRYRAKGIARSYAPSPVITIAGKDSAGKEVSEPLIDAADIYNDGSWHVVVGRNRLNFIADSLRVQVSTTDSVGQLDVGALEFFTAVPNVQLELLHPELAKSVAKRVALASFECINLEKQFNDNCTASFERLLEEEGIVTDGSPIIGVGRVSFAGIPFQFGNNRSNLIRPTEDRSVENETVEILGMKTIRRYFKPPGRDDVIEVPVGKKVSEVFLVLVSELPRAGARYNLPRGPHDFTDVGALAVELRYADGESDFAFPFSLADDGYALKRMAGIYAVPADMTRVLDKLALHNRVFGNTVSIAAVTVNTSANRVLPQLAAEPRPIRVPQLPLPRFRKPYAKVVTMKNRNGNSHRFIRLGNRFYEVIINCTNGFSVERLVNRWSPTNLFVHPSSGLEMEVGDAIFTGRAFSTESVQVAQNTATIVLKGKVMEASLRLTLTLTVDDSPQLKMNLSAVNTGGKPLNATVRFPSIRGLRIGGLKDTWMFFPSYRIVNTNRQAFFLSPNDYRFCVQFMDVYNPHAGIGLALLTHNLNNAPLEYGMGKDGMGIHTFVQSPSEHTSLLPSQNFRFTETCLVFHCGDWHEAFRIYKEWLRTWFRPIHAQDKKWFQQIFLMRTHLTKKAYSWAIPFYDAEKRRYKVDEVMEADEQYLGTKPDIVHVGGWCDYEHEYGGDFQGGDYDVKDYTGGADNLRAAIRRFQEHHRIPVSLYLIPDRCRKDSNVGKRLGEKIACRRPDGSAYEDERQWYICPAVKDWQDHFVEAVRRTQQETGVRAIYIDVFGYSSGWRCYSSEHGHEVPSVANKATYELIRRIREVLPNSVAIWSEFPLNDFNIRYLDGNIQYYCFYWHPYFGQWHNHDGKAPKFAPFAQSIIRFAFPNLKQFVFPCGMPEWSSDCQFPFFNGEATYDVSWCLYDIAHLERMKKIWALQKRFADSFTSANPIPDIPTEKVGVHANCFPSLHRTVWTLYNARYTTVRGPVLAVKHFKGATYYDAWNDRPLKPKVVNGKAIISLKLGPQEVGCVVQSVR